MSEGAIELGRGGGQRSAWEGERGVGPELTSARKKRTDQRTNNGGFSTQERTTTFKGLGMPAKRS